VATEIELVSADIFALQAEFNTVLVDKSLSFERESAFAVQIVTGNSYLCGVAAKNRQSLVNAITNVAAIGISLNPAKKQAYLVPRKVNGQQAVCLDISYMGLMDLAVQEGGIQWAQAAVVRAADTFTLRGYDHPPLHEFKPFGTDRGPIVGVYVVVKTPGGDYLTHPMSIADVHAIRDKSESWKAHVAEKKKTPWVDHEDEMVKKVCVKQGSKYWPAKSERLLQAIHHLNTEGGEGIELAGNGSALNVQESQREGWLAKIKATTTPADLKAASKACVAELNRAKDAKFYPDLVAAVQAHAKTFATDAKVTKPADPNAPDPAFVAAMEREETDHA
jgi:recombination protein RecT